MKKVKLKVSELAEFNDDVCSDCLNDDGDKKLCFILGELSFAGECDGVFETGFIDVETGSSVKCLMRRTKEEVSLPNILKWMELAKTEEIASILVAIEDSYHHGVIKSLGGASCLRLQ